MSSEKIIMLEARLNWPSTFTEAKGPYDKAVAEKLRKYIFTVGNTIDPEIGYRSFRDRDPKIDALMRKRGFPMKVKK